MSGDKALFDLILLLFIIVFLPEMKGGLPPIFFKSKVDPYHADIYMVTTQFLCGFHNEESYYATFMRGFIQFLCLRLSSFLFEQSNPVLLKLCLSHCSID